MNKNQIENDNVIEQNFKKDNKNLNSVEDKVDNSGPTVKID